jgi:hypothetical protein
LAFSSAAGETLRVFSEHLNRLDLCPNADMINANKALTLLRRSPGGECGRLKTVPPFDRPLLALGTRFSSWSMRRFAAAGASSSKMSLGFKDRRGSPIGDRRSLQRGMPVGTIAPIGRQLCSFIDGQDAAERAARKARRS